MNIGMLPGIGHNDLKTCPNCYMPILIGARCDDGKLRCYDCALKGGWLALDRPKLLPPAHPAWLSFDGDSGSEGYQTP